VGIILLLRCVAQLVLFFFHLWERKKKILNERATLLGGWKKKKKGGRTARNFLPQFKGGERGDSIGGVANSWDPSGMRKKEGKPGMLLAIVTTGRGGEGDGAVKLP